MRASIQALPFFGRGVAFPFRINPSTGGIQLSDGNTDASSVALEYLQDSWSIRETVATHVNHIAESIAHILLTRPGEHDTLPEFGSYLFTILFEPNSYEFRQQAEVYFSTSTIRWEKRAYIPEESNLNDARYLANRSGGIGWSLTGLQADRGIAPVWVGIDFIPQQKRGNLVKPFVNDRDARLQEYHSSSVDNNGHDHVSRYRGQQYVSASGNNHLRLRHVLPIRYSSADQYHVVTQGETWYSIAWKHYNDIRLWYKIAVSYISDNTDGDRSTLQMLAGPATGSLLRIPPIANILAEL
jgi:phage baseplate assembly protein W